VTLGHKPWDLSLVPADNGICNVWNSYITTAEQKCSPATRLEYRVPPAISVTDSDDVFVARMASSRHA
jgi:hypothetical protein